MSRACPSYICQTAANAIISEIGPYRVSSDALQAINQFLNEFLSLLLSSSLSLDLSRIKAVVFTLLPSTLGKNAIVEAELEVKTFTETEAIDFDTYERMRSLGDSGPFPLDATLPLLRDRCLEFCTLADREEQDRRNGGATRDDIFISPIVAIYVTTVLEHIAEYVLTAIAMTAEHEDAEHIRIKQVFLALIDDVQVGGVFYRMELREKLEKRAFPGGYQPRVVTRASTLAPQRYSNALSTTSTTGDGFLDISFDDLDLGYDEDDRGYARPNTLTTHDHLSMSGYSISGSTQYRPTSMMSNSTSNGTISTITSSAQSKKAFKVLKKETHDLRSMTPAAVSVYDPDAPAMNFEELMRSGNTMKVSLTPNRLRSIEVKDQLADHPVLPKTTWERRSMINLRNASAPPSRATSPVPTSLDGPSKASVPRMSDGIMSKFENPRQAPKPPTPRTTSSTPLPPPVPAPVPVPVPTPVSKPAPKPAPAKTTPAPVPVKTSSVPTPVKTRMGATPMASTPSSPPPLSPPQKLLAKQAPSPTETQPMASPTKNKAPVLPRNTHSEPHGQPTPRQSPEKEVPSPLPSPSSSQTTTQPSKVVVTPLANTAKVNSTNAASTALPSPPASQVSVPDPKDMAETTTVSDKQANGESKPSSVKSVDQEERKVHFEHAKQVEHTEHVQDDQRGQRAQEGQSALSAKSADQPERPSSMVAKRASMAGSSRRQSLHEGLAIQGSDKKLDVIRQRLSTAGSVEKTVKAWDQITKNSEATVAPAPPVRRRTVLQVPNAQEATPTDSPDEAEVSDDNVSPATSTSTTTKTAPAAPTMSTTPTTPTNTLPITRPPRNVQRNSVLDKVAKFERASSIDDFAQQHHRQHRASSYIPRRERFLYLQREPGLIERRTAFVPPPRPVTVDAEVQTDPLPPPEVKVRAASPPPPPPMLVLTTEDDMGVTTHKGVDVESVSEQSSERGMVDGDEEWFLQDDEWEDVHDQEIAIVEWLLGEA